jgi:hypothetical protein
VVPAQRPATRLRSFIIDGSLLVRGVGFPGPGNPESYNQSRAPSSGAAARPLSGEGILEGGEHGTILRTVGGALAEDDAVVGQDANGPARRGGPVQRA